MKILTIFTGGTIGSTMQNGWISTNSQTKYILLDEYKKNSRNDIEFKTTEPYSILSENLKAEDINTLISTVEENIEKDFDGIIITHGTDTLQYTASALAYKFGNKHIPIVLVSSNYPLNDKKANGNINFEAAVEFIVQTDSKGIFISYANSLDKVLIHNANSVLSHNEMDDRLFSIKNNVYAVYKDDKIHLNENYKVPVFSKEKLDFKLDSCSGVLTVNMYPGENFNYSLENVKSIIVRPYHSGTINCENESFNNLCSKAKKSGIPVFIINSAGQSKYETSKEYENLGIISLPLCSFPSIYVKCWIASSIDTDIEKFVQKPIAGEYM